MVSTISDISDEKLLASLKRMERFAVLTDSCFRIPFTQIRFGLDSIIGLVPVIGELIGLVLSLYLIIESRNLKLPFFITLKMLGNAVLDVVIGLIPVVGDVGDIAFKANNRNMKLLLGHLTTEYERRHQPASSEKHYLYRNLMILILMACLFAVGVWLMLHFFA